MCSIWAEQRYDIHDLFITYPDPLIPDDLRREIPERTLADGDVLTPVDEDAVLAAVEELLIPSARRPIESLAIVFLHAYANPANEGAAAPSSPATSRSATFALVAGGARGGRMGSVHHRLDAYVRPLLSRYLNRLQNLAALNFRGRFAVMLSNGAASIGHGAALPHPPAGIGAVRGALAAREWAATSISLICWVSTWVVPRQNVSDRRGRFT
ncbi:MAG: hydantoinase/oxoprolinase N-terminal domain-containing protein [Caldilineaceae bacterium]